MRSNALLATALCITICGCTSGLAIQKIEPGANVVGYPHRLKFTQFETAVTWRVIQCEATGEQGLKLKISAESKDKATPDPAQYYVIDPRSLQGPFRHTEFTMEWYDDRATKTINSSVDDQTAAAITGALSAVAKLASVGLAPFGGARGECSKDVRDALADIDGPNGVEALTKRAQKEVEAQTAVVTRLTAKAGAAGAAVDDSVRKELAAAQNLLEARNAVLAAEQARLKRLLDVLADTRTVTWPLTGTEFASTRPLLPSAEAMERWNMNDQDTAAHVYFGLLPLDGGALPTKEFVEAQGLPRPPGVPYREPRPMRMYVCNPEPCGADAAKLDAGANLVKASDVQVLQGGTMFYLPFEARTFAHIKSSAGFSQAGVLTAAGASQPRGAGSGAVEALKGAAEQTAAIVTNSRAAETARIVAQTDELKAKKALADAKAGLNPVPLDQKQAAILAFQVDATLATAERTKLEAEAALAAARAQLP